MNTDRKKNMEDEHNVSTFMDETMEEANDTDLINQINLLGYLSEPAEVPDREEQSDFKEDDGCITMEEACGNDPCNEALNKALQVLDECEKKRIENNNLEVNRRRMSNSEIKCVTQELESLINLLQVLKLHEKDFIDKVNVLEELPESRMEFTTSVSGNLDTPMEKAGGNGLFNVLGIPEMPSESEVQSNPMNETEDESEMRVKVSKFINSARPRKESPESKRARKKVVKMEKAEKRERKVKKHIKKQLTKKRKRK